jgi:dTDP-glucose 4,6-dehydratase
MSTLLVTGGAGFIGSNFIRYWLKNHLEDNVINLDALTYAGNLVSVKDLEQSPKYEFVQGDILDADLVGQLVEKADRVVHLM